MIRRLAVVAAPVAAAVALAIGLTGCSGAGDDAATPPAATGAATTAATAPATPPVRMLVKGDWGWGGPAQASVTRRMCAVARRDGIRTVVTTGDNFYLPDGVATDANWTRPEACLERLGVQWRPAWGNHDLGGDSTATVLGGTRRWYAFTEGAARVIVLDANVPGDADQRAFLQRALSRATEPVTIVVFHQPAYTAGLHEPGEVQQEEWVPLFRRYGVDLVLQGHNHGYERLVEDGVTYIVTGGGGAPVYPCVRLLTPGLQRCRPRHHFLRLEVTEAGVEVRAIAPNGRILDRVRIPAGS